MSLISTRVLSLVNDAKDHIDYDHVAEVAAALRATGHYGSEAASVAADVLALSRVLNGSDGDNVRTILGLSRGETA